MSIGKAKPLTYADRAALDDLPDSGWFDVAHAPVARPFYRWERLEAAGRVVDVEDAPWPKPTDQGNPRHD